MDRLSNLPAGANGVYFAPCGCEFSGGNWGVCAVHAKPHSEHTQDSPAPWCDDCAIPFVDDELDDCADESDVCPGCGEPHVSHQRTPADTYCFQCRYPDVA